jgi:hypothetical protein
VSQPLMSKVSQSQTPKRANQEKVKDEPLREAKSRSKREAKGPNQSGQKP